MSEEIKEIPEHVRAMADDLKKNATVEDNGITFEDDAFKKNLPEKFTYKAAKEYEKHKVDFSASVHLATGEIGNELIAKDGYDEVTTAPVDMIYGQLKIKQTKHKSGVSQMHGEETPWELFGAMTSVFTTRIDRKVGSVKIVREHIMREAEKMFGQ